ncbi:MAG: glycosyl transferase [Nitrospirae bacterium GWC2_57_13]|nr:MAG: glycosyl transferase [Nitrospirae bacterium GWC2_57_13]OGW42223.1 MAG: glycosyl transferase [Nitrospirae bacterium GWD2_57_8]HAS55398.1 glycosyl transferase [Nitrospiraceae bacterium]
MGDFYQTGVIATFHRLGKPNIEKIESELALYAAQKPVALVLPSLYSELQGGALKSIVKELQAVKYIRQIVVALGPCSADEFKHARGFFSSLPQETHIIWNSGPRMQEIYRTLEEHRLSPGQEGKGKSAWMAYGYILASGKADVIALHDCDILTYSRDLLARLVYPVVNPNLGYEFCKGFYARISDKMHGRVTRLLVTPLIRSLEKILGYLPLLVFFDSFRYPLAGEFSMITDLARVNRIPADWGLEVGVLAEVYRNTAVRRVCQVDLADNYEHKHQALSAGDPEKGLMKMAVDICKSLLRTLASEGVIFSEGLLRTLIVTYQRTAQDMLKRFEDDSAINGLYFDRNQESAAVDAFTEALKIAGQTIIEVPLGLPLIPSWNRVTSAVPDLLERIQAAVLEDNA